ncbi:coenzyme F420-0:L-glutamate ligase [Methanothermobacter tenebrarum]|uniref:Gamma-glutamyl ligase n=1 Tax=Methanothermobacter tenebrarum TaxID=680118 RepID=A0A328PHM5_9EURY|nr:coenzyme F420-0:L-glutamate ligase [Methanothermobacter tenebrarum]MBC7118448.1 coenzyme F420-0:L-glutamate ligase [Methanobacteriaceae archaeon]NPV63991.1 gamma-glutamyl ligase [Methanobacteriaceae archaeon]RAO79166.1 gamma-glutamyl ligase [Methanothermobacter tenebrarum]
MDKYRVIPVKTGYIKPNEGLDELIDKAGPIVDDGDYLVISETPVAISQGRIVDESEYEPSFLAFLLADVWSKYIWGYLLGPLFGVKKRTIRNLRRLPKEARAHKEVVLRYYGIKHALKPGSEAGIDLSNLPGTLVALLPENPKSVSEDIARSIKDGYGKDVTVIIVDTDATYKLMGYYFTPLPCAVDGIKSDTGFWGYLLGRFSDTILPTPIAVSRRINIDIIFEIAKVAEDYHKNREEHIETVYDMEKIFKEEKDKITIRSLESIEHVPALIIREI